MNDLNNTNNYLFEVIKKNIKFFLIIGIITTIAAFIFSSPQFIAPEYKSTAIIYPSNLMHYSEENPIEQMLQWFESVEIKNNVIEENQLIKHYNIDENDNLYYYKLIKEYDENISVKETRYESAEIVVIDESPEIAFNIVNSIIKNFNKVVQGVHLKRVEEDLKSIEYRHNLIVTQLDSLGYKKSNLLNQEEENYVSHNDRITNLLKEYAKINEDFHYLKTLKDSKKTYTNVIVKPYVSQKKVFPIRWLIVLCSVFFTEMFGLIILLFLNKLKQ
jgi:hypothetical protein